eukprot:3587598-Rhodomonas_salina.2
MVLRYGAMGRDIWCYGMVLWYGAMGRYKARIAPYTQYKASHSTIRYLSTAQPIAPYAISASRIA